MTPETADLYSFHTQKGFTLTEVAIAMIIIGLIIGGVFKGQELVLNARMNASVAAYKEIDVAVLNFYEAYRAIPGDMVNARQKLPACSSDPTCANGNGDKVLGIGPFDYFNAQPWMDVPALLESENVQFWKHLGIGGFFDGVNGFTNQIDWGQSHPIFKMRGGFHARSSVAPPGMGTMTGLTLVARNYLDGNWHCGGLDPGDGCVVNPLEAHRIDLKVDDGIANSGIVQAVSGNWSFGCGMPNYGQNGTDGYDHRESARNCDLMFKLTK